MRLRTRHLTRVLCCVLATLGAALFLIAHLAANLNLMLTGVSLFWAANLLYSSLRLGERILFFLFNFALAFFLFLRNVIEMLSGAAWHAAFSYETNAIVLSLIFTSLAAMLLGALLLGLISARLRPSPRLRPQTAYYDRYLLWMRRVLYAAFFACIVFSYISEIDKLLFMNGKEYYRYYAEYRPRVPHLFISVSALTKFVFLGYLATLPRKRQTLLPIALFLLSQVPMFLIGQRNSLLSALLTVFCYYVIRDFHRSPDESRWLGRIEKTGLAVSLPFVLAFLSIYEAIRQNRATQSGGLLSSIRNLFRSQGVTYDVVARGIDCLPKLPPPAFFGGYTFGSLAQYLQGNSVSSFLFGTAALPAQTVESALSGYNFGDAISYALLGNGYLQGAGLGSSYLIETFADFGFLGVALFSLVLGVFLLAAVRLWPRSRIWSFFSLTLMLNLFMLPRSSALSWTVPAFYIPMYILFALLLTAAGLLTKTNPNLPLIHKEDR